MPAPIALDLTSLDYDDIKTSLKNALASTKEFANYDFDQGGGAAILKVLAYTAWNNAYLLNQVASESFLDTAQLRGSIASHAKVLGYVPGSMRSARARVRMTWTGSSPTYFLRRGQEFSALVRGSGATSFSVAETVVVTGVAGAFTVDVDVYEGSYVSDAWVIDGTDRQRFLVSSEAIDTESLSVYVADSTGAPKEWTRVTTLLGADEASKIWFLQYSETGRYEVLFGTGVAGEAPSPGQRVIAEYRVTKGPAGNGARSFTASFNPFPSDAEGIDVVTIDPSSGGADAETLDSIRFRAPRHFRVQEHAIGADDYAILLREKFPEINDVFSFGGEEASPPRYGAVFIAIDLSDADAISNARRDAYVEYLSGRAGLTTRPVVIEPERSYVTVTSQVTYDPSVEPISAQAAKAVATATIRAWADDNLGRFRSRLRLSKLSAAIDAAHPAIASNDTTYSVYKKKSQSGGTWSGPIKFGFALDRKASGSTNLTRSVGEYTVWTEAFAISGVQTWAADDGEGTLRTVLGGKYSTEIGTVDYDTGLVTLEPIAAPSETAVLRVYVVPLDADLVPSPDTVVQLADEVVVEVETVD